MKNILPIVALVALTAISCSNDSDKTYTPAGTETTTQSADQPAITPSPAPATIQQESVPGEITTTIPAQPGSNGPVAEGMNPPHGQPGHRCDISVGAPLSSPPGQTPPASEITTTPGSSQMTIEPTKMIQQGTTQIPTQSVTPSVTPSAAPSGEKTVTAPGMNPPHGEPGHDCAVAVGAPLKK